MQNSYLLDDFGFSDSVSFTQSADLLEWLLKLAEIRMDTGIFPYAYKLGSCDIFPLWIISAAITYMKESGDYGILEEIQLHSLFNEIYGLSSEFAGIIGIASEDGLNSVEDTVSMGLFLCVCKEYLGLCRFLEMTKEATSAAIRLKWMSGINTDLSCKFDKSEWLPAIHELLNKESCRRMLKGRIDFHSEIKQFIRSCIFEIMRLHNKKEAQNFWLATSSVWSNKATSELVLGVRPSFQGLSVNPCIPDNFGNYEIKRTFRNAVYNILIMNPRHITTDIRKLVVDNAEYLGSLLPNFADGKIHKVEVTMGSFD